MLPVQRMLLTGMMGLALTASSLIAGAGCSAERAATAPFADSTSPAPTPNKDTSARAGKAAKASAAKAPRSKPLAMQMSWCRGAGCELDFTFSEPMVQAEALATASPLPITLTPPQKGSWAWKSPKHLVFRPSDGQMLHGWKVEARLESARSLTGAELHKPFKRNVWVPELEIGTKWASWSVDAGKPRFVGVFYDTEARIGRAPAVVLYDQPVEPEAILKAGLTVVDSVGRALPIRVFRPKNAKPFYQGAIDNRLLVGVEVAQLPKGPRVGLRAPSFDNKGNAKLAKRDLEVVRRLAIKRWEPSLDHTKRMGLYGTWWIRTSSTVDPESAKKFVSMSPTPKRLYVSADSDHIMISGTYEPGRDYTVTVKKGLEDLFGNTLAKTATHTVRTADHAPRVAVPQSGLVVERKQAKIPVKVQNVRDVEIRTYTFDKPAEFVAALNAGQKTECRHYGAKLDLLGMRKVQAPGRLNEESTTEMVLPTKGKPALACVEVRGIGMGSRANPKYEPSWSTLVQVTDLGVMAKLSEDRVMTWTTALSTGKPTRARVEVLDSKGKVFGKGSSARDGVALVKAAGISGTRLPKTLAVMVTRGADRAVLRLGRGRLAQPWQYGLRGSVAGAARLTAAVFTDRGAYRPGEKVHAKVIVRDPATFGPPPNRRAKVVITDARGKQVLQREVALDAVGGADVELPLADGDRAPTGTYTVRVAQGEASASHRFRVEEYRVPTFAVNVSDEGKRWRLGRKQSAVVTAAYMSGGSLAGRKVKYRVTRTDVPFTSSFFPAFTFGRHDASPRLDTVAAGTKKLDGQGRLVVDFPVGGGSQPNGLVRYEVNASVTDVDRQVYAGTLRRTLRPVDRYVGIKAPRRSVVSAKSVLEVPVVVVDGKGQAVAGETVVVLAERIDTHSAARHNGTSVDRVNHDVATAVQRCKITSGDKPRVCRVKLPAAGRYRILARRLGKGVAVAASTPMVATGGRPAAWPRFEHERIAITHDKSIYTAGETAKLVVANPFDKGAVTALLTLERNGILEHRVIELASGTPSIDVAVAPAHAPNVYASVALVRGRTDGDKDGARRDVHGPRFRMGYATLKVRPSDARARIEVVPASKRVSPGSTLKVDIHGLDVHGKGINGKATVAIVDEAVLKLTGTKTPDIMAQLFAPRPLAVRTAESRLELESARRDRHAAIFPGGDGDDEDDPEDAAQAGDTEQDCMRVNSTRGRRSRVRCPKDPIKKQRERSEKEVLKVRSNFASTAHWSAAVELKNGRAQIAVKLPDNDTTWRVMVVAADANGHFGSSDAKVVARKPLLVQPVIPRFVFPGDKLLLGALVKNGTDGDGEAIVQAELTAATIDGKPKTSLKTAVKAGRQQLVEFPVQVPMAAVGKVKLKLKADMGGHADAIEVTLPVLNPSVAHKAVETREVTGTGDIALDLPAARIEGSEDLEVVVSTNGLAALKDSVDYIMRYPHGCIEQTTSGAYPLLVLKDLLPEMGVEVDMSKLKKFAAAGVKRLLSFQTSSGGLSYWPGEDKPHAFGTAFGLTALIEAKRQGYDVDVAKLARMADYLEKKLHETTVSESMPHGGMADGDTKALFAMTLGRLGREQTTSIDKLWAARAKLTPFGLAFLGVAAKESKHRKHLVDPILAKVRDAARENTTEHWYEGRPARGWSMGSPLRTHAGALLAWGGAYPTRETSAKLLKGLVKRARGGQWGNTQENVFGIMAVATVARTKKAGALPAAELTLNGRPVDLARLEPLGGKGRARRLRLSSGEFGLPAAGTSARLAVSLKNRGGTPLTLTVRSAYQAKLSAETMGARSAGFKVTRRYETVDGKRLGNKVPLGSLVRVRVKVKANAEAHYVAIDDRLPAGLEPLNTNLKTTEKVIDKTGLTHELRQGLRVLSYSEVRDSRVSFYANEMPKGTYEFSYLARATTAGEFLRPAASAEAMYAPEVNGATRIDRIAVR